MNPKNIMRHPSIDKVTINMCTGEGGRKLANAEEVLTKITGQKSIRTIAKKTLPAFGIRKGAPIGCAVTLRNEAAEKFLRSAIGIRNNTLDAGSFDETGSFSFGIEEHTDFPGMSYDPEIGIFGMDIAVALKRPGYRICRRRAKKRKIPSAHRLTKEDAIAFVKEKFGVVVTL
jgi:large subunit ribosomal protein L5